ncbi:NfeD family protein [Schumannella sp. 10F1B-5-1]|uniref:NfeD family protein n=1 Tax=Schumannella sp. 10F1B-5-1 TaxID=2590780 RepID=UPI0011306FA6|nr:NfeD family protein [Schumannella sp. 10F1B-5-1]TPW70915.1 NfeD family protein [Schumannella sp. 10F1B-5-1]
MAEFLTQWAWVVWIALILLFVIIEMMNLEFTFLMLAIGSLGGLVSGLFGAPWWAQVIIAGVAAVLLLFLVRPALHRRLHRGADPAKSNVEALLGLTGSVVKAFDEGRGQVKLANGETWTARLGVDSPLQPHDGDRIVVTAIEGSTAVVAPAERTAPQ